MIKILIIVITALICAPTAAVCACADPARSYGIYPLHKWHAAQTEAEQKLDLILRFIDDTQQWSNMHDYISTWPHTKPDAPLQYTDFFTKDLIYAWSRLEKEAVDETCNGRYNDDAICGLEFNALTGSQDSPDVHFYHTVQEGADYAIIQIIWDCHLISHIKEPPPPNGSRTVAYKMVLRNGVWLMDGAGTAFSLNFQK